MKKVLLIEDDFYIRGLYKKTFEKKGYQVAEVENGSQALEVIEKEDFSLIILDLMLPGMPGLEVLEKIKKSTQAPIYILTNVGDETILKEAMNLGAEAYFIKVDYTPKQLVNLIEERENPVEQES